MANVFKGSNVSINNYICFFNTGCQDSKKKKLIENNYSITYIDMGRKIDKKL